MKPASILSATDPHPAQGTPFIDFDDEAEPPLRHRAAVGASMGASIGAFLVALVAMFAATATALVLPGFGVVAAGPLAAAVLGAGVGALNGGLAGALIGWGIPAEARLPSRRAMRFFVTEVRNAR